MEDVHITGEKRRGKKGGRIKESFGMKREAMAGLPREKGERRGKSNI